MAALSGPTCSEERELRTTRAEAAASRGTRPDAGEGFAMPLRNNVQKRVSLLLCDRIVRCLCRAAAALDATSWLTTVWREKKDTLHFESMIIPARG